MLTRETSFSSAPGNGPLTFAAGCFDGVHLGHRAVIDAARRRAGETGGRARVLTFTPHPARVLNPNAAPPLLDAPSTRMRLFRETGVDGVDELKFDPAFARLGPGEFLDRLCARWPALESLAVGSDWTFGRRADGDVGRLREEASSRGIRVIAVEPVLHEGTRISSTRIRREVREGRMEEAAAMLGRPFAIAGRVVRGDGRGRSLGYPTANVEPRNGVRPPPGIYAGRACLGHTLRPAAVYLGSRRTFHRNGGRVMEVHLLEDRPDLYDTELETELIRRIRDDARFESPQALQRRIARDLDEIRAVLG
ncbi:riboflavin biosynthesis protein RibF [Kiritimatiella glycovorans]|uniref:Riboflavin biosynthesis protein n=1 Tax=Kiritimatiella glycovorans TaxID=1307763 RepID=A0A0G3EAS0_9BACT|nr:riboflavin biosynthesis protein RibF [Kiritimatiella glycovorans]AKJ63353.1 Riboflavin biosynthesis protein RibF [Kiritimatiella glycovorans]